MTSFKRLLRETSYKILGKVGACRSGSHSLVELESSLGTGCNTSARSNSAQTNKLKAGSGGSNKRRQHHKWSSKKRHSAPANIPEALLIASKNYLPPVQFHHVHGPNVQLHRNKFVARRTQSFCQALVFSNRVILPNERVYIKVLEIAKGWSGTIRFGFTSVDPATLRYQMPKHACPDMTNEGHTWARALADEVIKRNSVIHFSYNTNGFIHYGINNQDCGIFHANVNTNQNLWFIVDIYGLTAAVELIDPRIHNATGDLDISFDDDDEQGAVRSTMFKSTSAMDELLSQHIAMRAKHKKRSRKSRPALYQHHHRNRLPEGVILPAGIGFATATAAAAAPGHQGPQLPNLSSVMLPSAQQNIYSPMPSMQVNSARPQHDYYQIMTHHSSATHNSSSTPASSLARRHLDYQFLNSSSISNEAAAAAAAAEGSSSSNSAGRRGARRSRTAAANADEQAEICQQLSSLQLNQSDNHSKQYSSSAIKASSSANNSSHHPVAAARRRLQSSIAADSIKDSHSSNPLGVGSSALKAKARQSVAKSQTLKSTASKDNTTNNNNNSSSPQSKDCPICFERPINCVLYQCGHMCTCYECGVKQWRTQQRTCPICRTIIKDVIKTYMS